METQHSNRGNTPKLHVGFFFLSLGFLVTLITSVVAFLNLAFSTLDKRFPDVLNAVYTYGYSSYDYESMRTALSTLIIFFPALLLVAYFWNKQASAVLGSIDTQIKKWLTYIVLFLFKQVNLINRHHILKRTLHSLSAAIEEDDVSFAIFSDLLDGFCPHCK